MRLRHTMIAPIGLAALLAAAPPPSGLDLLARYAGTWRLEARSLETPYSHAGTTAMTLANACVRAPEHLACAQTVDGRAAGMIVFTHDPATGHYASLPVLPDGSGHAGAIEVDGARVVFPWEEMREGKTVRFRVVNMFDGTDAIGYAKEYSVDGGAWVTMESGRETRVAR